MVQRETTCIFLTVREHFAQVRCTSVARRYLSTRYPPCDPVPEHQVPGFLTTCRRLSGRSIFQCSNSRAPSLLFSRFHLRLSSTWQKCFHTFSFFKVEHGLFIFSYDFQLEFVVSRLGIHVFSVFLFFFKMAEHRLQPTAALYGFRLKKEG